MKITINGTGKRFNYEWILKNIHYTFESGNYYAILGPNGSGKSTLLQMIAGILSPSAGTISYENGDTAVPPEEVFKSLSLAAPYVDVVEEFTMEELFRFQHQFKPFHHNMTVEEALSETAIFPNPAKQIRNFSSGMKQRIKVALAVLSDVPMVLLDEPTTNLDAQGVDWYLELIRKYAGNRLIIICSNASREYGFCTKHIDVLKFK